VRKRMLKVAVTGGRWYDDQALVSDTLDLLRVQEGDFILLHGNATGADTLAKFWAIDRGIEHKPFKAEWSKYGKPAGPIRNREMVAEADMLIAFPGNRGTNDCIQAAIEANVPVFMAVTIEGGNDER
jgi:YspA, cpYpsA-related SLOG family